MTTPAPAPAPVPPSAVPPVLPADVSADPSLAPPAEMLSPAATDEPGAMDAAVAQTRILPPWIWITGLFLLIAVILAISLVS